MCCCYYTITCRCLLWLVVSLAAILFIMAGVLTPKWLVGQPVLGPDEGEDFLFFKTLTANLSMHEPSIGIHHRCMTLENRDENCSPISIYGFGLSSDIYPVPWKAAMVFLVSGAIIQFAAVIVGVSSCCSIFVYTVSVFSLTGAIQAFAGVCSIIGMVLYPWGWGSQRVKKLCGDDAEPYMLGDCSIGWSLYTAAIGVALIFISSILSKAADEAANSDRVQHKIDEGKQLICIA